MKICPQTLVKFFLTFGKNDPIYNGWTNINFPYVICVGFSICVGFYLGVYRIQPSRELESFEVTCTFGNEALTIIEKSHEKKTGFTAIPYSSDGCGQPGLFYL